MSMVEICIIKQEDFMIILDEMNREDLIEVIKMKDELIRELKEELDAYKDLVEELRMKMGIKNNNFSGNGD